MCSTNDIIAISSGDEDDDVKPTVARSSIEEALAERILRLLDERDTRKRAETMHGLSSTTTIQETSNLTVTNRNVSIVNTNVAPSFMGNVLPNTALNFMSSMPQQQQPILAYNTFTGQHEHVFVANNNTDSVYDPAGQLQTFANNANQCLQNSFGYSTATSSTIPKVIRAMPVVQNQMMAPNYPPDMTNSQTFQCEPYASFGSTINRNINGLSNVNYSNNWPTENNSTMQAGPSTLYGTSTSYDRSSNANQNISFHSSSTSNFMLGQNTNAGQPIHPRPGRLQIHSIEEIHPVQRGNAPPNTSQAGGSEYINTSLTQSEMPTNSYGLAPQNLGSTMPMFQNAQNNLRGDSGTVPIQRSSTATHPNLPPVVSSPIRSLDRSHVVQDNCGHSSSSSATIPYTSDINYQSDTRFPSPSPISSNTAFDGIHSIDDNENSSESGHTIDWNSIPANREFSDKLKMKDTLIEQVEGFLTGVVAEDDLNHFRQLMDRACTYENIDPIEDSQDEREINISPVQTTSGVSSGSYLERFGSGVQIVNEDTIQGLSDVAPKPLRSAGAQTPKRLSIKINMKPYPKVVTSPMKKHTSRKRAGVSSVDQYSSSKRKKHANKVMSNDINNNRNKRKRETPKFKRNGGLCVESGVESDTYDAAPSPETEKTIAKRVRKRRRSCTENVKYFNESDDDIDLVPLAERIADKPLRRRRSISKSNVKAGVLPRIDRDIIASVLNEDLALSSDSASESECDDLPSIVPWSPTSRLARRQRLKRKRKSKIAAKNPVAPLTRQITNHNLRNTSPFMYPSNPKYRTKCVLCGTECRNSVNHYANKHPDSEVYISRISANMLEIALDDEQSVEQVICLFCEQPKMYTAVAWVEHYASHMGNKLYKCAKCDECFNFRAEHRARCANSMVRQQTIPLWSNGSLFAFSCALCRYVQLLKENIVKHLKNEHKFSDEDEPITNNIQIITLYRPKNSKPNITAGSIPPTKRQLPIKNAPNANSQVCDPLILSQLKVVLNERARVGRNIGSGKGPKNTNIQMYTANPKFKKRCVLCRIDVEHEHLSLHYAREHSESEVFISRISPKMMKIGSDGKETAEYVPSANWLKALCLFCETEKSYQLDQWLIHYSIHMGQHLYECKTCKLRVGYPMPSHSDCTRVDYKPILTPRWCGYELSAFACKKCNYVQLTMMSIIEHLVYQHGLSMNYQVSANIEEITLLPGAKKKIGAVEQDRGDRRAENEMLAENQTPIQVSRNAAAVNNTLKNDNIEMYASNKKYQGKCALCPNKPRSTVKHYVKFHPSNEVFPSRISPRMRQCIERNTERSIYNGSNITAMCAFCEELHTKLKFAWLAHFSCSTGEYTYRCRRCRETTAFRSHTGVQCSKDDLEEIVRLKAEDDGIYAYLCLNCNYVQMQEHKLKEHLLRQHNIADTMSKSYSKIKLLNLCGQKSQERQPNILASNANKEKVTVDIGEMARSVEQALGFVSQSPANASCSLSTAISQQLMNATPDSYISEKMLKIYRNKNMPKVISTRNKSHYIAFCMFCERQRCFKKDRWLEHFTLHTTEAMYQCNRCNCQSLSCLAPAGQCGGQTAQLERVYEFKYEDNRIKAYSCRCCSFVQLSRRNIRNHIELLHGQPADVLEKHIRKITLINIDSTQRCSDDGDNNIAPQIELPYLVTYAKSKSANSNNRKSIHSYDYTDDRHRIECVVCKHQTRAAYFSLHFDVKHPELEFFYSRLSEPMMTRIECVGLPNAYQKKVGNYTSKTYAFCPFCERFVTNCGSSWSVHLVRHTNENLYDCTKCKRAFVSKNSHKGKMCKSADIRKRLEILTTDENIFGFVCKHCHYIQFEEARTVAHVESQHDVGNGTVADHYKRMAVMSLQLGQQPIEDDDDSEEGAPYICPTEIMATYELSTEDDEPAAIQLRRQSSHGRINEIFQSVEDTSLENQITAPNHISDDAATFDPLFSDLDAIEPTYSMESKTVDEIIVNTHEVSLSDSEDSEQDEIIILGDSDDETIINSIASVKSESVASPDNNAAQQSDEPLQSTSDQPSPLSEFRKFQPKPWGNTGKQKPEYLLDDLALFALYKCMAFDCLFTTASAENMAHHLELHEKYHQPEIKNDIKDYLECAYCSAFIETSADLMTHIDDTHSKSIFQCQHCFYRSADAYAVSVHLEKYHENMERIILVCGHFDLTTTETHLLDILANTCDDIIPIECMDCTDKSRSFYVIDHYIWHIQHHHKASHFKCFKCNHFLPTEKIKVHLSCHKICDYHCLHCEHSAMSVRQIADHIAHRHSNKLMFAVARFYEPDCTAKTISAADRGKILILNLAAALDADNCDIRFRELELPESDLNAASPLSLPQFNGALNLTRTGRTLDSRAATSSSVIQILETYTLRLSISPILLINEFQAHHMCDYEKLESNM